MPEESQPDERTALLDSRRAEASEHDRVRHEIEGAMPDASSDTTLFDTLAQRPISVILALSLLALFIIVTSSLQLVNSSKTIESFMAVPDIKPIGAELVKIRSHDIEVKAWAELKLDYSKLESSPVLNSVAQLIAEKVGSVNISLDGPVSIYTKNGAVTGSGAENALDNAEDNEWLYVISAVVPDKLKISLLPDVEQYLEITAHLSRAGRTDVLGAIARRALKNEPLLVKAEGTAVVKKYGIGVRVPFVFIRDFSVPQQTTEDLAEISKVMVQSEHLHSINVTALANATIGQFPVRAQFPTLNWEIKIPGCPEKTGHHEKTPQHACNGLSLPFALTDDDNVLDVYFSTTLDRIPAELTEPCDDALGRSPLDMFVAKYIAGELSTFYIQGLASDDQPKILNDLLCGYELPYTVAGKAPTEKLIQSVTLEQVKFANQLGDISNEIDHAILDGSSIVSFSGRALVDVVLPNFLEMQAKTAILVTGIRGIIQLFDKRHVHFGQVLASRNRDGPDEKSWVQTVSLANPEGYKVTCFFDKLPMEVTDNEALAMVSREIFLSGHTLIYYDAVVDINYKTSIGSFIMKEVRIRGTTEMYA